MAEGPKVRLVRCPKCDNLLPELPDYSVYKCGGCGAVLRGMLICHSHVCNYHFCSLSVWLLRNHIISKLMLQCQSKISFLLIFYDCF